MLGYANAKQCRGVVRNLNPWVHSTCVLNFRVGSLGFLKVFSKIPWVHVHPRNPHRLRPCSTALPIRNGTFNRYCCIGLCFNYGLWQILVHRNLWPWMKLAASIFSLRATASLLSKKLLSNFLKMHILKGSKSYRLRRIYWNDFLIFKTRKSFQ